jgi:hypothetical protein
MVKAKPVTKTDSQSVSRSSSKPASRVENQRDKGSVQAKKDVLTPKTERSRVRTKKFKES